MHDPPIQQGGVPNRRIIPQSLPPATGQRIRGAAAQQLETLDAWTLERSVQEFKIAKSLLDDFNRAVASPRPGELVLDGLDRAELGS